MFIKKQTVLVVDDTPENIDILDGILNTEYNVKVAINGMMALKIAEKILPDIILLDIMMPGIDGYEVCKKLKENPLTRKIPVIFVTARDQVIDEENGFKAGAVDFIIKPVSASIVKARVRTHLDLYDQKKILEMLVFEKTKEVLDTRLEIIKILGRAAEHRDNETGFHLVRMSNYCKIIARNYGFPESESELLKEASILHDIGKIGIPDNILQKPGILTEEEWTIIRNHTFMGANIIGEHNSQLMKIARAIALEHHERWDGMGYPRGLKGEDISIYARITAIADVFDALTVKRPYKEAWPVEKAVSFINSEAGKQFDPRVIHAFNSNLEELLRIRELYLDDLSKLSM